MRKFCFLAILFGFASVVFGANDIIGHYKTDSFVASAYPALGMITHVVIGTALVVISVMALGDKPNPQ